VGGSSAINGLVFIPPSPAGIDAWAKLGNPNWNWKALRPYLQRSYNLNPPEPDQSVSLGEQANGPIRVTFPALADNKSAPLVQAWKDALESQGYEHSVDVIGERKTVGTRDCTATIDPVSGLRSSADTAYGQVAAKRANVRIIPEATVRRIVFSSGSDKITATGAEFSYRGEIVNILASKEVVLAAGAFQTPKILELSGIGCQDRLSRLGIPVVIDQPGVGENLQNHTMSMFPVPLKSRPDLEGMTLGFKGVAFTHLDQEDQSALFARTESASPASQAIQSILSSPDEASAVLMMAVFPDDNVILGVISSFPFSRGSCHITSSDPDEMPNIDMRTLSNDLDIEFLARHVQKLHQLTSSPALAPFLQSSPAPELDSLKKLLREAAALSCHHCCGTTAMLPRELGGIVDQELKVYGTENLRVVDASVFPLITHANPIATVYAVAERAADIICGR
jgi:choline dehydrogenase-like flavoprotein